MFAKACIFGRRHRESHFLRNKVETHSTSGPWTDHPVPGRVTAALSAALWTKSPGSPSTPQRAAMRCRADTYREDGAVAQRGRWGCRAVWAARMASPRKDYAPAAAKVRGEPRRAQRRVLEFCSVVPSEFLAQSSRVPNVPKNTFKHKPERQKTSTHDRKAP